MSVKNNKNLEIKFSRTGILQIVFFVLGLLLIISGGMGAVLYAQGKAEINLKNELINVADIASSAVNPRRLVNLEGNIHDYDNLDYQRLKEQLGLIDASSKKLGIKWTYLLKNDGKNWIFSVDPLDINSPDYTPPGTVYDDYPKDLDLVLRKKISIVVGPYTDKWGSFISVFSPVKDLGNGEILGVLGADVDISVWNSNISKSQELPLTISLAVLIAWISFFIYQKRRIKNEKEIAIKEERFKSIAETTRDVIYRSDLQGKITYASPAVEKVLNFSITEVMGMDFLDFLPDTEHAKAQDAFQRILRGNNIESMEILIKCKNKGLIIADVNLSLVHTESGNLEIQGVIHDVTQRRINEKEIEKRAKELKDSQTAILNVLEDVEGEKEKVSQESDKINAILHSIGDGVFVVDKNLNIIMINDVTLNLSGYSQEELMGKKYNKVLKFIFEKDKKENEEFVKEAIRTGEVQEMSNHTLLIKKDGSKVAVSDSAAPLKDRGNKVIGCVVVFRDATKEREIDRMKSEFVSVASHQLKTPLTGIRWFTELLSENNKNITKQQKEYIKEISDSNNRMIDLINDLLNVSRIETGKNFKIEKEKVDIIKLIEEVIKDQAGAAKEKGINIICDTNHPIKLLLNIDSNKIRQVFENLLSNAIKYSSKGGEIFFSCENGEKEITFLVKDSGAGIPADQKNKIFEKFFRASNVLMTGAEGTGLGLYIAKSIIEAHNGKIWFESEENKGTTFYVSLPKSKPA